MEWMIKLPIFRCRWLVNYSREYDMFRKAKLKFNHDLDIIQILKKVRDSEKFRK